MASSPLKASRKEWFPTPGDCSVSSVDEVNTIVAINVWANETTGDGWDDFHMGTRGWFKRSIIQTLLQCTQLENLGTTVRLSDQVTTENFMYKDEIPKVQCKYEVLLSEEKIYAGYRLFWIVHDPGFHFGNAILVLIDRIQQDEKAAMVRGSSLKKRIPLPIGSSSQPGFEWKKLKSLNVWRQWLCGVFPDLKEELTVQKVYATNCHLIAPRNPANPRIRFSLESAMDASAVPLETRKANIAPRASQMTIENYRRGGVPRVGPNDPNAPGEEDFQLPEYEVPGVRQAQPRRRNAADGGAQGDILDAALARQPPTGQARADALAARQDQRAIDNGYALTFPHPELVYSLRPGEELSPSYVFERLRPDRSMERRTELYIPRSPGALKVQDAMVPITDAQVQKILKGLEDQRKDLTGETVEQREASDLLHKLSLCDHTLKMRLANLKELAAIDCQFPEMNEAKKKRLHDFKVQKLREFMDWFLNCEASTMNKVLLAARNFYKALIDERGTLVMHTTCTDPNMGVAGNFLALIWSFIDQGLKIYTNHSLWFMLWVNAMTVDRWGIGKLVNYTLAPGDREVGKTFTFQSVMDNGLVPGTVFPMSRFTDKAFQTEGDQNHMCFIMDEAQLSLLGLDPRIPMDTVLKSCMTAGFKVIARTTKRDDESVFKTEEIVIPAIIMIIAALNNDIKGMDPALLSRWDVLHVEEDTRHPEDRTKAENYYGDWRADTTKIKNLRTMLMTLHMLNIIDEQLIKIGVLDDVSDDVARQYGVVLDEVLQRHGVRVVTRDIQRFHNSCRSLTILLNNYKLFMSELGARYKNTAWDHQFLLDVEPLLSAEYGVVCPMVGLRASILVPSDKARVLQCAMEIMGNEMPVEVNGKITNYNKLEFRHESSLIDKRKECPYDYIKLSCTLSDLISKVVASIGHPKPSRAVISTIFKDLEDSLVIAENRDHDSTIIPEGGTAHAMPHPVNGDDADAPHQMQLAGFCPAERHGRRKIKGLLQEVLPGGRHVVYIATSVLLHPTNYSGVAIEVIKGGCRSHTRNVRVLSGLPYKDPSGRKWPNLLDTIDLTHNDELLVIPRMYNATAMARPMYADTEPTAYLQRDESREVVTIVKEDIEQKAANDRLNRLVSAAEKVKFAPYIPSISETILKALHANEDFRVQCCVPACNYPEDIARQQRENEVLVRRIKQGLQVALDDPRIRVCTHDGNNGVSADAIDISSYMPSTYMKQDVVARAMELNQQIRNRRQPPLVIDVPSMSQIQSSAQQPQQQAQLHQGRHQQGSTALAPTAQLHQGRHQQGSTALAPTAQPHQGRHQQGSIASPSVQLHPEVLPSYMRPAIQLAEFRKRGRGEQEAGSKGQNQAKKRKLDEPTDTGKVTSSDDSLDSPLEIDQDETTEDGIAISTKNLTGQSCQDVRQHHGQQSEVM